MQDFAMMNHLPGLIYSDRIYRCQNCNTGSFATEHGFQSNRCINCGRYYHGADPINFGITRFFKKTGKGFLSLIDKISLLLGFKIVVTEELAEGGTK